MILEDVKILLDIKDKEQDKLLEIYIRRAIYNIKTYLNAKKHTDEDIRTKYHEAVVTLTVKGYENGNSPDKGVKTKRQGSRTVTYVDNKWFAIDEEVSTLLPPPFVKLV